MAERKAAIDYWSQLDPSLTGEMVAPGTPTTGVDYYGQLPADWQFDAGPTPEEPEPTWGDVGVSFAEGANTMVSGLGGALEYSGQVTGWEGLQDVGTAVRQFGEEGARMWREGMDFGTGEVQLGGYTPAAQEAMAKQWFSVGEQAAWKDPSAWLLGLVKTTPYLITSLVPGAIIAKLGAGAKAIASTGAVVNAAQVGGGVHAAIASEIEGYSDETFMKIPGVKEYMEQGMTREQLEEVLIAEAAKYATPIAGTVGAVSGMAVAPIQTALITKLPAAAGKSKVAQMALGGGRVRGAGIGGTTEALQESVESGTEQLTQNIAMGRPATEGLAESITAGTALGFGAGAGVGVASPPAARPARPTPTRTEAPPTAEPTPTPTPAQVAEPLPDQPGPEPAVYIQRQMKLLDAGVRNAVLVGPESSMPEVDTAKYDVAPLPDGSQVIVRKGETAPITELQEAVASGDNATIQATLGGMLGYGIAGKPTTGQVLTVRDTDGGVVQDVVFDDTAPDADAVIEAANRAVEALGEGARVEIRSAQDALLERETEYYNELNAPVPTVEEAAAPEPEAAPEVEVPPTAEPVAPTTPQVEEEAVVPRSEASLNPIPDDENPAMQAVSEQYRQAFNKQSNAKRPTGTQTRAEAAEDMVNALIAYYPELKKEGYNLTGFHKLFWPVTGRKSMKALLAGNFKMPTELAYKTIGSQLTPEIEAVVSETEMGPGRKSGQQRGKEITTERVEQFFAGIKEYFDKINADRQAKRAAPATKKVTPVPPKAKPAPKKEPKKPVKPTAEQRKAKLEEKRKAKAEAEAKQKQEAEAKKKAEAEQELQGKLETIKVNVPVIVEETGQQTTIRETAANALAYEETRIRQLKQLIGCLLG